MSKVTVYSENGKAAIVNPSLLKIQDGFDAIRKRAFELFAERGCGPGGEIDDWLRAERDLFFVPAGDFAETDKGFTIKLAIPGFESRNVEVVSGPKEIVVCAKSESAATDKAGTCCTTGSKSLYRRFDLLAPIDATGVKARLDKGTLTIEALKMGEKMSGIRSVAA